MDSLALSLKLKPKFLKETSLKLKALENRKSPAWVRSKAQYIANSLHNTDYLPFFRKVAWRLPERKIDDILERARKPGVASPLFYFIGVCKDELGEKRSQ